jgi:hypothetical protein
MRINSLVLYETVIQMRGVSHILEVFIIIIIIIIIIMIIIIIKMQLG